MTLTAYLKSAKQMLSSNGVEHLFTSWNRFIRSGHASGTSVNEIVERLLSVEKHSNDQMEKFVGKFKSGAFVDELQLD